MRNSSTNLLLIDTAQETAWVGWSCNGLLQQQLTNQSQKEHATFLHPAIASLTKASNLTMKDWQAVAVMNGPGSYTGLRVGLSAAKGICYALDIPLICINTLEWMAFGNKEGDAPLICPMIDARRSEVFTAIYDQQLTQILEPQALILNEQSFASQLDKEKILFIGSGSVKWKSMCSHPNAVFNNANHSTHHFATMSQQRYDAQRFNDLFFSEPDYAKGFYSTAKKSH